MQFSLKTLFITSMLLGSIPAYFMNVLIPFAMILIVAIIMGAREFGRDINADPPNFS